MHIPSRLRIRGTHIAGYQSGDTLEDESYLSLGGYDIMKPLGEGSYGKVRVVRQKGSGQFYALKYVDKKHCKCCNFFLFFFFIIH